ncbi:MAG: type II toxin-antitoxin system HicA family toxin [Geminicoccaceae bacterium]
MGVNRKHRAAIAQIFARQAPADLAWRDIEALFRTLGADIEEGAGSRVVVKLNEVRAVFHRPHPKPLTRKGAVKAVRILLYRSHKILTYGIGIARGGWLVGRAPQKKDDAGRKKVQPL